MNAARGMAGQSHPHIFGNTAIGEERREGMPQRVERMRINTAAGFVAFTDDALRDACPLHDFSKCF